MLRNGKALSTSTVLRVRGGNHGNNMGYSGLLRGLARITLKALPPFGTHSFKGASAKDHSDH